MQRAHLRSTEQSTAGLWVIEHLPYVITAAAVSVCFDEGIMMVIASALLWLRSLKSKVHSRRIIGFVAAASS